MGKMFDHIDQQADILEQNGLKPSFHGRVEPGEWVLSWYNKKSQRCSISLWEWDKWAFLSIAKNGDIIEDIEYTEEEFINEDFMKYN